MIRRLLGMKQRASVLVAVTAVGLLASDLRANAPAGQYTAGSGTVTDNKTGLVWQQVVAATGYTFTTAPGYCAGLSLNGTGWRVPTVKELMTLVDVTQTSGAAMDSTAFPGEPANQYWTSTFLGNGTSFSWYVDFSLGGYTTYTSPTTSMYVRCVR
jgi:hypothetical protein